MHSGYIQSSGWFLWEVGGVTCPHSLSYLLRCLVADFLLKKPSSPSSLVAGRYRRRFGDGSAKVVFDGNIFQIVVEFVYLGTLVTCHNDVFRDVKRCCVYEYSL